MSDVFRSSDEFDEQAHQLSIHGRYDEALAGGVVERIVRISRDHDEAAAWDVEQHVRMTPEERLRVARTLKDRAFPPDAEDVRACHQSK